MTDTHKVRVRFTRRKGGIHKGMTEWYPQNRAQRLIDEGYAILDMPIPLVKEEPAPSAPKRRGKKRKQQEVKVEGPAAEPTEATEATDINETTDNTTSEDFTNG